MNVRATASVLASLRIPALSNSVSDYRNMLRFSRRPVAKGWMATFAVGVLATCLGGCPPTPAGIDGDSRTEATGQGDVGSTSNGDGSAINTGDFTGNAGNRSTGDLPTSNGGASAGANSGNTGDSGTVGGDTTNDGAAGNGTSGNGGVGDGGSGSANGGQDNGNGNTGSVEVVFDPNPTLDVIPTDQTPPTMPAGPLSVVTLGDSLTEGSGDQSPEGGGYPFRLLSYVQARRADSSVFNVGHSGWSSTDLINGFDGAPSELDQAVAANPDIACVWIGSNDLWALYAYGPEDGTTADLEAADLKAFAANIDTILSRLTASGAAVYIALSDDQSLRPAAGTALWGISPVELTQMSKQVIRYNNVLIAAAKQRGATVVDFYHTTLFTNAATLDGDGIHPNDAGYDQVAAIWWGAITPAIK